MPERDLAQDLAIRDLTDPAQGPHALQLIVDALVDALHTRWGCAVRLTRAHPVVTLADNYETLGFAPDAVTRDARYTRYVDAGHVLRGHTTAMVPGALRRLAADRAVGAALADVLLACPGICYRRDSVDWQHTGTPHQLDLWRIRDGVDRCTEADLAEMIELVVGAALPGSRWRMVPAAHPYTEHGREIYAQGDGGWVEIGECGLAAPAVLSRAGLDVRRWSGLAMGLGLDRLAMLRKGIQDIRLLRSTDPRVAAQLLDLGPYRPVSAMPPVRRDLSVAVGPDVEASAEVIGDRVREALGSDADVAETVEIISETPYHDLPPAGRARIGIRPGQRNLLVRLVLRALDRTLTDDDANRLRDRVYAALHEGVVAQWAAAGRPDERTPCG
ncbi:MAG TPA: hypothetical protein VGJ95_06915 [Pseudonocardiaceae bacterium]